MTIPAAILVTIEMGIDQPHEPVAYRKRYEEKVATAPNPRFRIPELRNWIMSPVATSANNAPEAAPAIAI
jgi:hypothetical protein